MPTLSDRVHRLHATVRGTQPAVSAERAILITEYRRRRDTGRLPAIARQAGAMAHVLRHRTVRIHAEELLVGSFSAHRVGGELFPELHGVAMLEDLLSFEQRAVNPLQIAPADRRRLLADVVPYWLTRFMALQIRPRRAIPGFLTRQLSPLGYLINETGGISHFVPNYERLLADGMDGLREDAAGRLAAVPPGSDAAAFLRACIDVCGAIIAFGDRYRAEAARLAALESDPVRRAELDLIANVCARVPARPATTLQEALQSILLVQIALNCESLDNSVSPGRLDRLLSPFYLADCKAGRTDPDRALELLGCFAVKLCEIVPVFSRRATQFFGGMFNGQVVVVGGTDRAGADATCELTTLMLQLMRDLHTRQPNWHARVHPCNPPAYRASIAQALAAGAASPAVYNDSEIVPVLTARGITLEDARDYANVGCVEPVAAGRGYMSTDAALVNLPLCLELALNEGRRLGHRRRIGARTPAPAEFGSMGDVLRAFDRQVQHLVQRLLADLRHIERANADVHPTPLTSVMVDGCVQSATDASAGGARYNGSGLQGVGVVDVGDSLAAIESVVFLDGHADLKQVVAACRADFDGCADLRARLRAAPHYVNDDPRADGWVARAMAVFARALDGAVSVRGGRYVAGYYSVTSHLAFGRRVGASPSGRGRGEPFSSGLSPGSGGGAAGPTAALSSVASLPSALAPNGVNFNLELSPDLLRGPGGPAVIQALLDGGMAQGCMQLQINVLDPRLLIEARDHPGRHPGLLVRVSGYSAYFDDLDPEVQQEVIDRARFGGGAQ